MKSVKLFIPALTLAAASSLSLAAQQPVNPPAPDIPQPNSLQSSANAQSEVPQQSAPDPQSTSSTNPSPTVAVPHTADAAGVNSAELRPVTGELVKKIDSKNAKAGDEVVVKTTENATFADGVALPKGSKLMGHVTEVQAHDKSNENSKLTLQFDQAELKGGQKMPIKSVLQALAPAAGSDAAQSGSFGSSGSGVSGAYSGPAPGGSTGSGSTGSGSTGSMGNDRSSAPMPPQTTTGAPTAGSSPGMAPAPNGLPAAGTVVAHQGNIDIRTTGIPGVLIAAQSNGQPFTNAAGALLGARQNVQLDGGTKVTMAIADANNKAGQ
jgi:hypothetical protein